MTSLLWVPERTVARLGGLGAGIAAIAVATRARR